MKRYKVWTKINEDDKVLCIVKAEDENEAARLFFYDLSGDFKFDADSSYASIEISVNEIL